MANERGESGKTSFAKTAGVVLREELFNEPGLDRFKYKKAEEALVENSEAPNGR